MKRVPEKWREVRLGDIGEFQNGINKDKNAFGKGIPFVNLQDVFGHISIKEKSLALVNASVSEQRRFSLVKGDILFVRSSVKPSGVGLTILIEDDLKQTVFSGFLIRFRQREKILLEDFAKFCFFSSDFRKSLLRKSTISANTNINQQALKKLKILVLPKNEQIRIAHILTIWSEAIEKTEALIVAKEKRFKWLLKQLISDRRDDPKWRKTTLGDLFNIYAYTSKRSVVKETLKNSLSHLLMR